MIVACVRTGRKYSSLYVYRLKKAVERYLGRPHRFICLTDSPKDIRDIETVQIYELPGWWGKMKLFDHSWRGDERVIYFDLDTVITGDLSPLADLRCQFGICENFTRRAGNKEWPCHYGSCVMSLAPDFGTEIWREFRVNKDQWMAKSMTYGDQWVIENICNLEGLVPRILQHALPGFFLGYRDLPKHVAAPRGCSVVVFAGQHKPHNTDCRWAREAWAA